jgi:Yip1 domain
MPKFAAVRSSAREVYISSPAYHRRIWEKSMADEVTSIGDVWVDSWFTIWYRPRATIRRIVDTDPTRFVLGIAWLVGALSVLNSQVAVATTDFPANAPHWPRLGSIGIAIMAFLCGVISVVSLYGFAALYRWAGHILGGTAQAVEVRAALAWAQVPGLYLLVVTIIATVLGLYTPPAPHTVSPLSLIESIVGIWVFVILLKCLGEVHRFSAWRALGAIVLGTLAMFAVAIGFVVTIWLAVLVGRSLV